MRFRGIWVSQNYGYSLGTPIIRTMVGQGLYWGPLCRKTTITRFIAPLQWIEYGVYGDLAMMLGNSIF